MIIGGALLAMVALARMFALAPFRAGWAMVLANVAWEVFPKKAGIDRFRLEAASALAGLLLLGWGGVPWLGVAGIALLLLALEFQNRRWEKRLLSGNINPGLLLTLEAPLVSRWPRYDLGVRWVGVPFDVDVIVSNPSRHPTPADVEMDLEWPGDWQVEPVGTQQLGPLGPGGVGRIRWTVCPTAWQGGGEFRIRVTCGAQTQHLSLRHDGCRFAADTPLAQASISRYPGGRRSAFCWRGDMDLYDTLTAQTIEGLNVALGLAARYAMPQTMCLSTRLTLDQEAARAWAAHDGRDHGAEQIPRFIEWMNRNVDLRHAAAYPAKGAEKPYVMELGNHGHLHYDTAAAAAPENGWTSHARMGAGRYPWMGEDASSFGEQRDNIREAARWFERCFSFVPRSWAKPGRGNDSETARAAEAAGCEVLSGSDIRARDNVLFQPPPHHPAGTHAVELTSRYPPDPQHIHHLAMLVFWLHRSHRLARPMVFMCHQHMRQWEGPACTRFTEEMLRRALGGFHGDLYADTMFAIGSYWREVLSPETRRVSVEARWPRLMVRNDSDRDLANLPVDLELAGNGRSTVTVLVPAGAQVEVDMTTGKEI